MGGAPRDPTARFGLASAEVVVASSGGRFLAKNVVTQAAMWKSDLFGQGTVADIADVNGDGAAEVIAYTDERAYALSASSGAALWSSPPGAFGRIGAVRVADMNGDGLSDIYIDDGSGAKTGTLTAAAYAFAGGFSAPTLLWSRSVNASPPAINASSDAIVDLNGDGIPEVALASYDEVLFVRGSDGATIASLAMPSSSGDPFSHADAIAAELDGQGGKELLVVQTNGHVATSSGPPGFSAFKVDPVSKASSHLWTRRDNSYEAEIVSLADVAADIDGDGADEVIFSHRSPQSALQWVTEVLDGATGTTLFSIPGSRFEGAAELDGEPGDEIAVASADGLSLYSVKQGAPVAIAGPLEGMRALAIADPTLRKRGQVARRLAVLKRAGQKPVVLAGVPPQNVQYPSLPAVTSFVSASSLTLAPGGFVMGESYTPLAGVITDVISADFATRPYAQVAMGTSDGTLDVLDDSMKVTNGVISLGDPASGTTVGGAMQPTAGAQGGPVIGADALGRFVVLPGSPKGLLVANAALASWVVPPLARWIKPGMTAASILDFGPGMGVAVVGVDGYDLRARSSATGALLGMRPLGPGVPWGTPLPLRVAGSPVPLVGMDWRIEGVQIVETAVNFTNNTTVWTAAPLPYGGFFGSGVGDLDGDGTDEWYSMNGPLNRRSAASGALDTFPTLSTAYSIPMVAHFTGAAAPDLLLQAGATGPKLVTSNMVQAWEGPLPEQMNVMAGTRVACGNAARFVTPAVQSPSIRAFDGASGALLATRVLAGGAAYPSVQAAQGAKARIGSLTNASSVAAAGGQGPAVLVGSSDGFLYALDGCSLDLLWAKDIGAPVAEPVIGSTDGDAGDEIVVGAADGYIYGLDWPGTPTPPSVKLAGAGPGGGPASVKVGEPVVVSWSPAAGATGYEVALVGPEDEAIWDPPYHAVVGESASISLEGALARRPYRVAVRALGPEGASNDAFSPAVVIADTAVPAVEAQGSWGPEEGAQIAMNASDDLALDHYVIRYREAGAPDADAKIAGDDILSGKEAKASFALDLPAEYRGKSVVIDVDVIDSGGNIGRGSLAAQVGEDGEVRFESKAVPGFDDVPSFDSEDIGQGAGDSGGCATTPLGSRSIGGGGAGLAIGLSSALLLFRRRRRG
jgi:outer membrane protein assembly factor BamB